MATSGKALGIVVPTGLEAHEVLRRFPFRLIGRSTFSAQINDRPVFLCISGIGRQAARRAAERLLQLGAEELLSMGFCGALLPELHAGDLITDRLVTVD